jgi:hypothetical protein
VDDKDYQVPLPFTGKINKLTVKLRPGRADARRARDDLRDVSQKAIGADSATLRGGLPKTGSPSIAGNTWWEEGNTVELSPLAPLGSNVVDLRTQQSPLSTRKKKHERRTA